MWLFLPDAFYSVRAYDPDKGGIPVDKSHVVVRARVKADVDKVRDAVNGAFDLPEGPDYKYHLALPADEWTNFLKQAVDELGPWNQMKDYDNPRIDVHSQVWHATLELESLDNGS